MTTQQRDFLIGVFVLVVLGILAGTLIVTSGWGEERYELFVRTASAADLTQDTRVVLQGLTVGRVRSVAPVIAGTGAVDFVVRLSLRNRFPNGTELRLPRGTSAVIDKPTPIAASIVNLLIPDDPPSDVFVEPGDTLAASRPDDPLVQLGAVARQLNEQLTGLLEDVRRVLQESDRALGTARGLMTRTQPAVDSTLAYVASAVARTDSLLAAVEPRVDPLLDSLQLALSDSRRAVGRVDTLVQTAQSITDEHRDTIAEILATLQRSSLILEHFADQVSRRPTRLLTGVRPPEDSTR